ncbi:hypothetical protein ACJX0J_037190, partial [Zea mays]
MDEMLANFEDFDFPNADCFFPLGRNNITITLDVIPSEMAWLLDEIIVLCEGRFQFGSTTNYSKREDEALTTAFFSMLLKDDEKVTEVPIQNELQEHPKKEKKNGQHFVALPMMPKNDKILNENFEKIVEELQ